MFYFIPRTFRSGLGIGLVLAVAVAAVAITMDRGKLLVVK